MTDQTGDDRFVTPLTDRGAEARNLVALLRRRGWLLLLCAVVIPAAVYLYTDRLTHLYRVTVVVEPEAKPAPIVPGRPTALQPWWTDPQFVAAYAKAGPVIAQTAALVHRASAVGGLTASLDPKTGWVHLSATGPDARTSATTAMAFERGLDRALVVEARRGVALALSVTKRALARETDPVHRAQLSQSVESLRQQQAPDRVLSVVQRPGAATVVSPHPRRNALLGVVLGLLVGVVLIAGVEYFDRRVRRADQLAELIEAPHVATLPKIASAPGRPQAAETFARLRDTLIFAGDDRPLSVLVVVSPGEREGRTTVAVGLAMAFARAGQRVVLLDANMRKPQVASSLGLPPGAPGLGDVLRGHDLERAFRGIDHAEGDLRVLPAGVATDHPAELLGSPRMSALLERLEEESDLVVIDTPPLLAVSDALPLLRRASGVLAVVRFNRTPKQALRRTAQITARAHGRLLAVVATGAGRKHPGEVHGLRSEDMPGAGSGVVGLDPSAAPKIEAR